MRASAANLQNAPGATELNALAVSVVQQTTPSSNGSVALHSNLVSDDFLRLIPRDFARSHLIVSQGTINDCESLAVAESSDPSAVFNTGVRLGRTIAPMIADPEAIAQIIDDVYGRDTDTLEPDQNHCPAPDDIDTLLEQADRDLLSTQGKAHVVKLVDAMLFEALTRQASDVHIQPVDDRTLVRYRLDGVLHPVREISKELTRSVVSRIKVMGRMDIAERRTPQDGRATVTIGTDRIDLRLSTLPTSYGERAVIRLLDQRAQLTEFDALGMLPDVSTAFLEQASRSTGIVLITGPTGSGKTTTLYATLRRIGNPGVNIMTVEDPIEYDLSCSGLVISQSQVNPKKGVTFASGLRHILRQDPDVVMVGEIRDAETACIAIQSSLTGHLVFSTLHTNDAASAVTRLIDLGVELYLVSASLNAVLAQRLLRRLHQSCKGKGCDECLGTGFHGRTGLFELLVVNEQIRDFINRNESVRSIRNAAHEAGMCTLYEEGQRLIRDSVTNELEAKRVIQDLL